MNKLIVTAAVLAGLALGPSAFAADSASGAMSKAPAKAAATSTTKTAAKADPKTAACQKEWKAEKAHKESEKAYVKACLAKAA